MAWVDEKLNMLELISEGHIWPDIVPQAENNNVIFNQYSKNENELKRTKKNKLKKEQVRIILFNKIN